MPEFNVLLVATDGTDIAEVDAWWGAAGAAAEIDSQEYHFYRDGWLRTEARHSRMLKYGIFPHHFAPTRVDSDWDTIYTSSRAPSKRGCSGPGSPSSPSGHLDSAVSRGLWLTGLISRGPWATALTREPKAAVPSGLRSEELATSDEGRRHVKAAGGERGSRAGRRHVKAAGGERGKQSERKIAPGGERG
jgi:hypothetical protein